MSFAAFDGRTEDAPMNEINMVPFIDIMLVLLIVFIVTAPLLTHAVKVDLPKASTVQNKVMPDRVTVSIKSDGSCYINGVATDKQSIKYKLADIAKTSIDSQIQLYADEKVEYKYVMDVMSSATNVGLTKIAFVSSPNK